MDDVGWLSPDVTGSEISSLRSKEGKKPVRFVVVVVVVVVVVDVVVDVVVVVVVVGGLFSDIGNLEFGQGEEVGKWS